MVVAPLLLLLAVADAPAAAPKDLAVAGVVVGTTPDRSSAILVSGGKTRVVAVGEAAAAGAACGRSTRAAPAVARASSSPRSTWARTRREADSIRKNAAAVVKKTPHSTTGTRAMKR